MIRDLREALRSLGRTPGFTGIVVSTLALLIGVNVTIFSALDAVVLSPLGYAEPDRLVMIWESNPQLGVEREDVSGATFADWRERSTSFESMAIYRYKGGTLTGAEEPEPVVTVEASPALFPLLGVGSRIGRVFTPEEETPGNEHLVILSHGAWTRRFASDPGVLGGTVSLDGEPYTIVGVMPEGFTFPAGDPSVEMWSPLTMGAEVLNVRPHRMYVAIGRLTPGASMETAGAEMSSIAREIADENPMTNRGWGVNLVGAKEQFVGPIGQTLWVLFAAVALVLLIGCVNIANLLMARSIRSARDYAVRAAFGASAGALLRRSLTESMVLAVGAGLLGAALATGGVGWLRRVLPAEIPRTAEIGLDPAVLAFAVIVTLTAGLLFGLLPALRVMRPRVSETLQDAGRGATPSRRSRRLGQGMVASEVALALVLLTGAGLLVRSFLLLTSVDPGFRVENVVSAAITLPATRYGDQAQQSQFFTELTDRVTELPGIDTAGVVSSLPLSSLGTEFDIPFSFEGLDASSPSERPQAKYRAVVPGYFETLGIPVVEGRSIDRLDGTGTRMVTVINQVMATRYFGERNPVGTTLNMPMLGDLEIVGVVGDVRHQGLAVEAEPEVFVPLVQLPLADAHLVVRSELDLAAVAALIREEVGRLDPQLPLSQVASMESLLSASVAQPRFNMALILMLAVYAVILAGTGVYGVISYSVAQRTGEIGLRMALGASAPDTVVLVVRQAMGMLLVGTAAGVVGSIVAGRFIRGLLYSVSPSDPLTLTVVVAGVVAMGLVAAAIPAVRAARVHPVEALRTE
jgi:predicted permease